VAALSVGFPCFANVIGIANLFGSLRKCARNDQARPRDLA
jgi:hypothetical protein